MKDDLSKYNFVPSKRFSTWKRLSGGTIDGLIVTLDPLGALYSVTTKKDTLGGIALLSMIAESRDHFFPERYENETTPEYAIGNYIGVTVGTFAQVFSVGTIALASIGVNLTRRIGRYFSSRTQKALPYEEPKQLPPPKDY